MKYYCKAVNTTDCHSHFKIVEADNREEALRELESSIKKIEKTNPSAKFSDIEIYKITRELESFVEVKTNGHTLTKSFYDFIHQVQAKAFNIFGSDLLLIRHYYRDKSLDVFGVILKDGSYCNYSITINGSVRAGGHGYSYEYEERFKMLETE